MAKSSLIYVKIIGQGIFHQIKCVSHSIEAHPASTYHVFIMENGNKVLFNDFGVRTVTIADSLEKLSE